MDLPRISTATPDERDRFLATITLGFAVDPLVRFATPGAANYLAEFQKFNVHFGGRAFENESAWVANDGQAVALWLPPGVEPDSERMMEAIPQMVAEDRLEDMLGVFEGMASFHPEEPHWYLPVIAADPQYMGLGLGGALMKHACARIDEDGLPAYLESSNPRNISLYERHGFEIMGEIRSGKAPTVTPMYREARA